MPRTDHPVPDGRTTVAGEPARLLTRHADVRAAIAEPALRTFLPGMFGTSDSERAAAAEAGFLMMMDGPPHQRLRRPLAGALSARRIAMLRPLVEQRSRELVEQLARDGTGDVVRGLAAPLAIDALGALIGVDVTARPDFVRWSDDSAAMFGETDPERMAASGQALFGFVAELVESERPGDGLVGDLFRLVPDDGVPLTDGEVGGVVGQLLLAGYVPTAMAAASAVHRLLSDPGALATVRSDPGAVPGLVDELLRLDPGGGTTVLRPMRACGPVRCNDHLIDDGEVVVVSLGAANRDPDVFADPDRVDPYRRPNPYLTFFPGPHHCVGAGLARAVIGAAITALLDHPSGVAPAGAPTRVAGALGEMQLTALPVTFGAPHPAA